MDTNADLAAVVWVPDANLLDVEYEGDERADQILQSVEEFAPEQWGLPPYGSLALLA